VQIDKVLVPTRVTSLGNVKVIDVSLGLTHTAVLTDTGKVITFGRNSDGQLGRGHTKHSPNPGYVKPLMNKVVTVR
jgi:NIMA (never in mitosis gene a)-related kinase